MTGSKQSKRHSPVFDVVLPAASDVVRVDQIGALMKTNGLGVELGDLIGGEHLANHEEPIRPILRRLCRVDRADGGVGGHDILRSFARGASPQGSRFQTWPFDELKAQALILVQKRTPMLTPTVRGAPISPMKPDGAKLG